MLTYNQVLNLHALRAIAKPAVNPDFELAVGEGENLFPQFNPQIGITEPVSSALIQPELAVENTGLVGDGNGVLDSNAFISNEMFLGLPQEV